MKVFYEGLCMKMNVAKKTFQFLEFSMHVSHFEVREKLAIPKGPRGDFFLNAFRA